jgi:hypothetical protein
MTEPILVSKRAAATALGISVRTLENLMAMREITPRRIGKRVLFDIREIQGSPAATTEQNPRRSGREP